MSDDEASRPGGAVKMQRLADTVTGLESPLVPSPPPEPPSARQSMRLQAQRAIDPEKLLAAWNANVATQQEFIAVAARNESDNAKTRTDNRRTRRVVLVGGALIAIVVVGAAAWVTKAVRDSINAQTANARTLDRVDMNVGRLAESSLRTSKVVAHSIASQAVEATVDAAEEEAKAAAEAAKPAWRRGAVVSPEVVEAKRKVAEAKRRAYKDALDAQMQAAETVIEVTKSRGESPPPEIVEDLKTTREKARVLKSQAPGRTEAFGF